MMVSQAVSEFWTLQKNFNLDIKLEVPGRSRPYLFRFNKENQNTTKTLKKPKTNEGVNVTAEGTGKATLTMVTHYYAVPRDRVSDCTKFNLSVEFTREKADEDHEDIYRLKMEFIYENKVEDASMTILDITVPTGFIVMTEDLDLLSEGSARLLSRYEIDKALSEKGSLILELNKVSRRHVEELVFRMRHIHNVGVFKPAAILIYEYYDENSCVQKKSKVSHVERITQLCQSGKFDFFYNVIVESIGHSVSFDTYVVRIENVIKTGTKDLNAQGQLRDVVIFSHYRDGLNLQVNKGYLIMGRDKDTLLDPATGSFEYLLREETWIDYWPSMAECQTEEHSSICSDIHRGVEMYQLTGCIV